MPDRLSPGASSTTTASDAGATETDAASPLPEFESESALPGTGLSWIGNGGGDGSSVRSRSIALNWPLLISNSADWIFFRRNSPMYRNGLYTQLVQTKFQGQQIAQATICPARSFGSGQVGSGLRFRLRPDLSHSREPLVTNSFQTGLSS